MQCLEALKAGNWLRLSHILSRKTPAYGNGPGFTIESVRSMCRGDTCNSVHLSFSNHLGSHVDAPRHFIKEGKAVDDYLISEWIFNKAYLIEVKAEAGEVLGIEKVDQALEGCVDADLLLIRTGFEMYRDQENYWANSPGFSSLLANYLVERLPTLSAIGFDTISLTSYQNREIGREAHRAFLGAGLRIFEDLSLAKAPAGNLQFVMALPLIFENADGAPCTMVAWNG